MPDSEGHPYLDEIKLEAIFAALAEPKRMAIIQDLLADKEGAERHCTSFGLDLSKSTRSHHFRVLREAGLIRQIDRGNSRMAQLRREDIDARFPNLLALIAASTKQ